MSRLSAATKSGMMELAVEIIALQGENKRREDKGIGSDCEKICSLYDLSDTLFCAQHVKSLLDELTETQAEVKRLRGG